MSGNVSPRTSKRVVALLRHLTLRVDAASVRKLRMYGTMLPRNLVASSEKPVVDWVNFPEGIPTFSLWDALHDGDLLSIESDLLARTVTLRFDVDYVRDFHHLPEGTQFVIIVNGVASVRSLRSVPWPGGCPIPPGTPNEQQRIMISEYHRKWREESQSWNDFEQLISDGLEVSNATLGRGSDAIALQLGLMVGGDFYVEAYIRGDGATFHVGEKRVTLEEFFALGEAYWKAFSERAEKRQLPAE